MKPRNGNLAELALPASSTHLLNTQNARCASECTVTSAHHTIRLTTRRFLRSPLQPIADCAHT
eukprot:12914617-Prorocentrum_lima.AAC.1